MSAEYWNDIVFLNLKSYENIGFDFYINIFLFAVAAVFCLFALYIEYTRGMIYTLVFQLKRHKAYSPEDARTVSTLGIKLTLGLKLLIKNNRMLSRVVARVGNTDISYDEYMSLKRKEIKKAEAIDFDNERFYILPESSSRTEDIISSYGFSFGRVFFFCIFIIIVFTSLAVLCPEILRVINNNLEPATNI